MNMKTYTIFSMALKTTKIITKRRKPDYTCYYHVSSLLIIFLKLVQVFICNEAKLTLLKIGLRT